MTIFRDLPEDLVVEEILCHVPATYLKRLQSTCKRWNRLFNGGDSRFAREHTDKAAEQLLVLLLNENRICPAIFTLPQGSVEFKSELSLVDPYSAQFVVSQVTHCDGLLLCTSRCTSRFVVWNPFTGETRWFQRTYRVRKYGEFYLGYYRKDNDKKSYKVLSFSRHLKDYEVYEFSSDSWRTMDDILPRGWHIDADDLSVSLKGNTYWFASDRTTKGQRIRSLLKFDYETEKSVPVPLPYQCTFHESAGLSVVREEKLSLLYQRDVKSKTEIWVTNKIDETTQVVSWTKVLALYLSPDLHISNDVNFLFDEEKKVVMICKDWWDYEDEDDTNVKNMIYTVGEDEEVTQVQIGTNYRSPIWILNYVPSLVQIEQARKRKRGGDLSKM